MSAFAAVDLGAQSGRVAVGRFDGERLVVEEVHRFANVPVHLPGRHVGDLVTFGDADISDWMFMRNGKIVGCETTRPLLKSMSKADANAFRARLETPEAS